MSTPTSTTNPSDISVSSLFTKVGPRLLMLLVMHLSTWLTIAQFTPPAVVSKAAPATEFSAERAMTYLPAIAKEPHPMGSPASAESHLAGSHDREQIVYVCEVSAIMPGPTRAKSKVRRDCDVVSPDVSSMEGSGCQPIERQRNVEQSKYASVTTL